MTGLGIEFWWRRVFCLVLTGLQADSASCTKGSGSFPEVKRPQRYAEHSPPSSDEVANVLEPYLCLPSVPS